MKYFDWKTYVSSERIIMMLFVFLCINSNVFSQNNLISGNIFLDWNNNGIKDVNIDENEAGIQDVEVFIHDNSGTLMGSALTQIDGSWSISIPDGTEVRVAFDYTGTMSAGVNSELVHFVTAPATDINLGLVDAKNFAGQDPEMITSCYSLWWAPGTTDQIVSVDFSDKSNSATDIAGYLQSVHPISIPKSAVGPVWGLTYNLKNDIIYSASTYKSTTGAGSNLGNIYYSDNSPNDDTHASVTSGAVLSTLSAGTDPSQGNSGSVQDYLGANWAENIEKTTKVGLGDLDINPTDDTLFTINLHTRQLVVIPLDAAGMDAGTSYNVDMPTVTNCNGDIVRPYGLAYRNNKVYVGMVCTAENSQDATHLRAYVYTYDTNDAAMSATSVLEFPLNYPRSSVGSGYGPAEWRPWLNEWNPSNPIGLEYYKSDTTQMGYPQPIFSDIEFYNDDMILIFEDRFGNQFKNGVDPSGHLHPSKIVNTTPGGDLLRAGYNGDGTWTIESNATITSTSTGTNTSAGANNTEGPDNGEFYFHEAYGEAHEELTIGGATQVPGKAHVAVGAFDPTSLLYENTGEGRWGSAGFIYHDNQSGDYGYGWEGYWASTTSGTLTKGNGFGDVEHLRYHTPIEIGNRVWMDTDEDGIQDAEEPGIDGAIVSLVDDSGTVLAIDTTDLLGNYIFTNAKVALHTGNALAEIERNTNYFIVMTGTINPLMAGYQLTSLDQIEAGFGDSDLIDSDGRAATAADPAFLLGQDFAEVMTEVYGDSKFSLDFGYTGITTTITDKGFIGNKVWYDEDGDGFQDDGEPGIANVMMLLTDATGSVIAETITDMHGKYGFRNLSPGTYGVSSDANIPSTLPSGMTATILQNTGADLGNQIPNYSIILGQDEENLTADFGFVWGDSNNNTGVGALGSTVWLDANMDGNIDKNEAGIGNVTVTIYNDSNADGFLDTVNDTPFTGATDQNGATGTGMTTTKADGSYMFYNLPVGAYIVIVDDTTLPGGGAAFVQTGDPDPLMDHKSEPIIIAPGDTYLAANFGYDPTGVVNSIAKTVYFDVNANGTQEASEPGIENVSVVLYLDVNNNGAIDFADQIVATDVTDENGEYLFADLADGNYLTHVSDSDNVLGNMDQSADPDGAIDHTSAISVAGGMDDVSQNYGYTPKGNTAIDGVIGSTVFLDRNLDNLPSPGEGIEFVTVNLLASDGTTLLETMMTDENGHYSFGGLDPMATYVVEVDETTISTGIQNSVDPDGNTINNSTVDLSTSAGYDLIQNFGYIPTTGLEGSVSGTIWEDRDANGMLTETGLGMMDVTVALYADINQNGLIDKDDPVVGETTTDANGDYEFLNLPTINGKTYIVDVTDKNSKLINCWHSEALIPMFDNNSQQDGYAVTIGGIDPLTNSTADFGYYKDPASVGNLVWRDDSGNGIQDAGEPGLASVEVSLNIDFDLDGTSDLLLKKLTSATGRYSFDNLLLDEDYNGTTSNANPNYTISINIPNGYVPTGINTYGNANDLVDSDLPNGTSFVPLQGKNNTLLSNMTEEIASYDFGIIPHDCSTTIVEYAITDGAVSNPGQTTNFFHNENTNSPDHEIMNQQSGAIRAITYCNVGNWRYYFNPNDPNEYLLAIEMLDNVTEIEFVQVRVEDGANLDNRHAVGASNATFVMARDWFVQTVNNEPLVDAAGNATTVNMRFYFPEEEYAQLLADATDKAAEWGLSAQTPNEVYWFKKDAFDIDTDIDEIGANLIPFDMTDKRLLMTDTQGANTAITTVTEENGKNHIQFNGITSFSGGTAAITISTPLDVNLRSFSVKNVEGCTNSLNWTAEDADNFSHFEVEKSTDGITFFKLGDIKYNNTSADYNFEDRSPIGFDYYRLKMVDLNGAFKYSEVISTEANCDKDIWNINVYPNPITGQETLKVDFNSIGTDAEITVLDYLGRTIYSEIYDTNEGTNSLFINVDNLTNGLYIVNFESGFTSESMKLVVNKK